MVIIDYGMGNLNSVKRKFSKNGIESIISNDPDEVLKAEKLVLPGVGHFKKAVQNLKISGLWDALNHAVVTEKVPILGICLGMQLMAKHSEEGDVSGLGWFDGEVVKFKVKDQIKHKIPHIGWNTARKYKDSFLFDGLPDNPEFYFVHSYHFKSNDQSDVLSYTNYEYGFCSAIQKDNVYGVQFHPEKSHDIGEQMLLNFSRI